MTFYGSLTGRVRLGARWAPGVVLCCRTFAANRELSIIRMYALPVFSEVLRKVMLCGRGVAKRKGLLVGVLQEERIERGLN